jgi:hypothetical protein
MTSRRPLARVRKEAVMPFVRSLTVLASCAAVSLTAIPAQAAAPRHAPPPHAADQAREAKRAACEKVWSAQKIRHGTRQAFVTACVAKG